MTELRYPAALCETFKRCNRWIRTKYHDADHTLVLPNGWDAEVIAWYALHAPSELIWWSEVRDQTTRKPLAPFTKREALAAIRAAREANYQWATLPVTVVRTSDGWVWETTLGNAYNGTPPVWRAP